MSALTSTSFVLVATFFTMEEEGKVAHGAMIAFESVMGG